MNYKIRWTMEAKLMDSMEAKFDTKMDSMEAKLDTKMDSRS
jgi:hypothetical protein